MLRYDSDQGQLDGGPESEQFLGKPDRFTGKTMSVSAGSMEKLMLTYPGVFYPIITLALIFTLTAFFLLTMGFGPVGVAAGM